MTTTIDRYTSVKNTIQILGTDTAGIDSTQSLRYQKVTFRTPPDDGLRSGWLSLCK
jgi:hypothetical protein